MPPPTNMIATEVQHLRHHQTLSELLKTKAIIERVQPYLELNDGNKIPMIGLGTWNAQGKELKDAVKAAITSGYRHIDTASNYKNEHLVGEAINECIEEKIVKREDLFVTTKLWNNSHSRGSVERALRRSLCQLQTDYVDLYLVHYPIGYQEGETLSPLDESGQVITSDVDYVETWYGMEDVKRLGLTKSIGVSNFNIEQISRIISNCSIMPTMNQVECHPYLTQERLFQFCVLNGILLTAYSPLGSPGRIDPNNPQQPYLIEDPLVRNLARKYQRSAAHILIRYQIQRKIVVIPKAIQEAHVKSNLEALCFEIAHDDMNKLSALNRNHRFMRFERCLNHKYYPFNQD